MIGEVVVHAAEELMTLEPRLHGSVVVSAPATDLAAGGACRSATLEWAQHAVTGEALSRQNTLGNQAAERIAGQTHVGNEVIRACCRACAFDRIQVVPRTVRPIRD